MNVHDVVYENLELLVYKELYEIYASSHSHVVDKIIDEYEISWDTVVTLPRIKSAFLEIKQRDPGLVIDKIIQFLENTKLNSKERVEFIYGLWLHCGEMFSA